MALASDAVITSQALPLTQASSTASKPMVSAPALRHRLTAWNRASSGASAKTVQRLNYAVGDLVDVITMPLTQDRLADISRKAVAVYAVTDRNLAKLCFDRLSDCGAIKNEEDMSE